MQRSCQFSDHPSSCWGLFEKKEKKKPSVTGKASKFGLQVLSVWQHKQLKADGTLINPGHFVRMLSNQQMGHLSHLHTFQAGVKIMTGGGGGMRGVAVTLSAFLACHKCYYAGLSLTWGLNLWALVCGIFWSSSPRVFSRYSSFPPSFIGLMVQPIE